MNILPKIVSKYQDTVSDRTHGHVSETKKIKSNFLMKWMYFEPLPTLAESTSQIQVFISFSAPKWIVLLTKRLRYLRYYLPIQLLLIQRERESDPRQVDRRYRRPSDVKAYFHFLVSPVLHETTCSMGLTCKKSHALTVIGSTIRSVVSTVNEIVPNRMLCKF